MTYFISSKLSKTRASSGVFLILISFCSLFFPKLRNRLKGTWVTQLVKGPTLGFGAGHELTVHEFEPHIGLCSDSVEPAWDSLSPSLPLSSFLSLSLSLSLKINIIKIKKKETKNINEIKGRDMCELVIWNYEPKIMINPILCS